MERLQLIHHAPGARGLRWFGLGPGLKPTRALWKLQRLFNQHAFWARDRTPAELRKMLKGSTVVVSLWRGKRLVGFGRATSDEAYRAVLWDIVIPEDLQGKGLGRQLVEALLDHPSVKNAQRIYLMTTNGKGFYEQLGFQQVPNQILMHRLGQNDD